MPITLLSPFVQSGPNTNSETDNYVAVCGIQADQAKQTLTLIIYPCKSITGNPVTAVTIGTVAPMLLTVNCVNGIWTANTPNGPIGGQLTGGALTGAQLWLSSALTSTMQNQAEEAGLAWASSLEHRLTGRRRTMSYFEQTQVKYQDSANLDAFSRLRMSGPVTLFDSTQPYGDDALVWENSFVGSGAVSNIYAQSAVRMTTGGTTSTWSAIRSTKKAFHYFPGKSQFAIMTFVMDGGGVTNNTRRAGYFDAQNGVFFELAGTTLNVVQRSYVSGGVVETRVAQSSWNLDKLDGTGSSGFTLTIADAQILVIDLQWLGVGRVRIGFDIGGQIVYCHQFLNANALTTVYMTTAILPIRFENTNTGTAGGTATLTQICASVCYEGQQEPLRGLQFSASNGQTAVSIPSSSTTTWTPIISIQAQSTGPNSQVNRSQMIYQSFNMMVTSISMQWALLLNGTLTAASFSAVNSTYSVAGADVSATGITGGVLIDSGFVIGGTGVSAVELTGGSLASELALVYSDLLNVKDTLTLAGRAAIGSSGTANASMNWIEI